MLIYKALDLIIRVGRLSHCRCHKGQSQETQHFSVHLEGFNCWSCCRCGGWWWTDNKWVRMMLFILPFGKLIWKSESWRKFALHLVSVLPKESESKYRQTVLPKTFVLLPLVRSLTSGFGHGLLSNVHWVLSDSWRVLLIITSSLR